MTDPSPPDQPRSDPAPAAPQSAETPATAAPDAATDTAPGTDTDTAQPAEPGKAIRQPPGEIGGPKGPEPTRYGDWEVGGRCSDF